LVVAVQFPEALFQRGEGGLKESLKLICAWANFETASKHNIKNDPFKFINDILLNDISLLIWDARTVRDCQNNLRLPGIVARTFFLCLTSNFGLGTFH